MGSFVGTTTTTNSSNSYESLNTSFNSSSKSSIKSSKSKAVTFKLHIAIDFGTDGCGLAFAYKDKVIIYNKWRAQQTNANSRTAFTTKTKTQLILNEQNEATCFGNAAKFSYFNLTPKEQGRKKFFERFKMALYEKHLSRSNDIIEAKNEEEKRDVINTAKYLYDKNKNKIESKFVFIAAFHYLQQMAKDYIPKNITREKIEDDEIQWILTVPAIWSEKAKNTMKDWMIEAKIVNKYIIGQCVIVYEPDCASLSMQKQYFKSIAKNKDASQTFVSMHPCDYSTEDVEDEKDFKSAKKVADFKKDDKYILIDAGGGTVDIACHKILDNGCVEEIVYPTGNKWGSCYIDDLYIKLLKEIFDEEWIKLYENEQPAGFVEVLDNFQKAKESFYKDSTLKTHRILLPDDFVGFLTQETEKENTNLATKIDNFGKSKKLKYFKELFSNNDDEKCDDEGDESVCSLKFVKVRVDDGDDDESDMDDDELQYIQYKKYIELDVKIWKCLFDSKINPIISHVEELLDMQPLKDCKFLGLVGGFSCSKYFQSRMQTKFGEMGYYQMTIVIPRKPMLSVVEGAALMAITQFNYIRARKLKYTYGIRMHFTTKTAKECGIPNDYVNNKDNITEDGFIRKCFEVMARKNERVAIGDVKSFIGYRTSDVSLIPVLRSDKYDPKIASDGDELAALEVPHHDAKKEVVIEFHFYGTIFKVYAYPKSSPNTKQQVDIKYVK